MARPTWVTAVGVIGIVFGCTGILGGGQQMLMPKMLEFQKAMMADMQADMRHAQKNSNCHKDSAASASADGSGSDSADSSAAPAPAPTPCQSNLGATAQFPQFFTDLWNFPPWFATLMEVSGALRSLIGAFYLFSAIWFIQLKPSAIWLFSAALSLSIVLGIAQFATVFFTGTFLLVVMMAGSSVGMLLDAVLLVVIWMSDRSAFRPIPQP